MAKLWHTCKDCNPVKPIVFLDFDGILNTYKSQRKWNYKTKDWQAVVLDDDACEIFKRLISKLDFDIVIHSSWKHWFSLRDINKILAKWNIKPAIGIADARKLSSTTKGHDIMTHLGANWNDDIDAVDFSHCPPFIVIDDELHSLDNIQKDKIVHVFGGFHNEGFSEAHLDDAFFKLSAQL